MKTKQFVVGMQPAHPVCKWCGPMPETAHCMKESRKTRQRCHLSAFVHLITVWEGSNQYYTRGNRDIGLWDCDERRRSDSDGGRVNMAVAASLWILALICLAPVLSDTLPKVEAFFQGMRYYLHTINSQNGTARQRIVALWLLLFWWLTASVMMQLRSLGSLRACWNLVLSSDSASAASSYANIMHLATSI